MYKRPKLPALGGPGGLAQDRLGHPSPQRSPSTSSTALRSPGSGLPRSPSSSGITGPVCDGPARGSGHHGHSNDSGAGLSDPVSVRSEPIRNYRSEGLTKAERQHDPLRQQEYRSEGLGKAERQHDALRQHERSHDASREDRRHHEPPRDERRTVNANDPEMLPTLVGQAPTPDTTAPSRTSRASVVSGSSAGGTRCDSRQQSPVRSTVAPSPSYSASTFSRRSSGSSVCSQQVGQLKEQLELQKVSSSLHSDGRWASPKGASGGADGSSSSLVSALRGAPARSRERATSMTSEPCAGSRASSAASGSRTPEPHRHGRGIISEKLERARIESASRELVRLQGHQGLPSESVPAAAEGGSSALSPTSPVSSDLGSPKLDGSGRRRIGHLQGAVAVGDDSSDSLLVRRKQRLEPLPTEDVGGASVLSSRGASPQPQEPDRNERAEAARAGRRAMHSPKVSRPPTFEDPASPESPDSPHVPKRPKDDRPQDSGPRARAMSARCSPEPVESEQGADNALDIIENKTLQMKDKHKKPTGRAAVAMAVKNPRLQLRNGSRDDSFLSTISEGRSSSGESSSTQRDSKCMVMDGAANIEVFTEAAVHGNKEVGVMTSFHQLSGELGEQMQQCLRGWGWEKPLEMQRRVVPLVMASLKDESKNFVTVQGATQCGKTSALVLGLLGPMKSDMPGIRAVVLSTSTTDDFKKYFSICSDVHPAKLECFQSMGRKVTFEGLPPDPESAVAGADPIEDLQRLSNAVIGSDPAFIFGHPARVLPLLREAPSWGVDLSGVQVLALDDAEETIRMGLMDEVCEVCTILRHFSRQRLRHIILSQALTHEAKSMIRCLRNSLLKQENLFGIRAHRTQARARSVNHYYAVAARARWPAMLAALHNTLSLPSGIIFDDESAEARARARTALRGYGVTASVWNALNEQGSGARAAARDGAAPTTRGPAFHLMPSDLVVLKVDLPQVRCVLHFEVPRREISIYGLRLMCLEQNQKKESKTRKAGPGGRSLSVLFVEEEEVVRELEKTFGVKMQEVPTEMLVTN